MLNSSEVIESVEKRIALFPNPNLRRLSNEIIYYYHKYGKVPISDFISYLNDKEDLFQIFKLIIYHLCFGTG